MFVVCSADGSDSRDKPKLYRLQLSVTEVGTEKFDDNSIQVWGGGEKADSDDRTDVIFSQSSSVVETTKIFCES